MREFVGLAVVVFVLLIELVVVLEGGSDFVKAGLEDAVFDPRAVTVC